MTRNAHVRKSKEKAPCPFCGEEIDANAASCPHCGSDEQTGWSEQRYLDGIDLPGDDDYEHLRAREFGAPEKAHGADWKMITGAVVLAAFVLLLIRFSC
jgi:hypothetical protein